MPPKAKKAPVADSWEDESSESEPEPETSTAAPKSTSPTRPPPAVPAADRGSEEDDADTVDITSRLHSTTLGTSNSGGRLSPPLRQPPVARGGSSSSSVDSEQRRPEKTNAVARRLIAGALGVRVKTTAEQREFDKALREKEKKRKEERRKEKEEEERREKAKRDIWED